MTAERNVSAFNKDVEQNRGYLYAATGRLSCRMSNARISRAIASVANLEGQSVIDVGCGDGTYTIELAQTGAGRVLGVDAADKAVEIAREKAKGIANIEFEQGDIYQLGMDGDRFDIAVVRGILHHLYEPQRAIARLCAVADTVIVVEPNGYNPVLKLIEKLSRYHVEHEEKSYMPSTLDRWFERCGGTIAQAEFVGLVPMFCPDWMARTLKFCEPLVERVPVLRQLACGQYVQKVELGGG